MSQSLPFEVLRDAAVKAFGERHQATYGGPPLAAHAWIDGRAILLVARARAASEGTRGRPLLASLAELQHTIAADVYLRTGEFLRPGGRTANSERGLLVLAFERVHTSELVAAALRPAASRPR